MLGLQSDGPGCFLGISLCAWEKRAEKKPGDLGLARLVVGLLWGFRASESGAKQETEGKPWGQRVMVAHEPCEGDGASRRLLSPQKGIPGGKSHWEQELPAG